MRRIACISMNDSPGFAFAILPVALSWQRIGWDVRVNISAGTPPARPVQLLYDGLKKIQADVVLSDSSSYGATTADYGWCRLARYFDAHALAADDVFTVTGDADMMRVAPLDIPAEHDGKIVCWGYNLYDGTPLAGRQPTCYVGGCRRGWKQLEITQADIDAAGQIKGWDDETVVQMAWERKKPHRMLIHRPTGQWSKRVDRADWYGVKMLGQVDAHFMRDSWRDAQWEQMFDGVAQILTREEVIMVEQWRQLWVSIYGR
jgi:hypothetical protein